MKVFCSRLKYIFIVTAILLTCLAGPTPLPAEVHEDASVITDIDVKIIDTPPYETDWKGMATDLIYLKKGDLFSEELLRDSVTALSLCKQFADIHVDARQEAAGMRLIFQLLPYQLIKDIEIDGIYPLFERDILTAMTIYVGDAYIESELAKQAPIIADLYRKEGFHTPKVRLSAEKDDEDGYMVLSINIDKEDGYYVLDKLLIEGNESFSDSRLKRKMKTWRISLLPGLVGRFIPTDFDEDIKNLIVFYRKKKFADIDIESKVEKNEADKTVTVSLFIKEGRQYDWEFVGNEEFWDYTLNKDIVLLKDGNKNNRGLKKSKKNILNRYKKAGYLNAKLTINEEKNAPTTSLMDLRFVIEEGPCIKVESVEFKGNQAMDKATLELEVLTSPPGFLNKGVLNEDTLQDDAIAIRSVYLKEGYMESKIKESVIFNDRKDRATVVFNLDEGVQTKIASVQVTGITVLESDTVKKTIFLKSGDPFRKYMIVSDENALAALIAEKGYPHVKVTGKVNYNDDKSEAEIIYEVDEGPAVKMGNIFYTGNFRTKKKIIQNELEIDQGDPFSLVQLLKGQRNIRNMDVFNSVNFKTIGLKEKSWQINMFAEIEESKPYYLKAGLGFESDKGPYANLKVGDKNLFGTNKDIWFAGEYSMTGYRTELVFTEPRLYGSRILMNCSLFAEDLEEFNQDFGTRSFGATLKFNQRYFEHLLAGLGFRLEQREQFKLDLWIPAPGEDENDLFGKRTVFVMSPNVSYDTRDSFIRPQKGIFSSASINFSKGIDSTLDDFMTYKLDFRYYTTPLSRITLACLARFGHIEPYDSSNIIPDDQLFFLGGTADVRGFAENELMIDASGDPVGGRTSIAASLEARIDLGKNFELTLFYDTGRVTNTSIQEEPNNFRHSAGGGIRYITPIGPVGFLYGVKLNKEEESNGRLHFSLGYTF